METAYSTGRGRNWQTAFILSTVLGFTGVDRFYLGKPGTAMAKILTLLIAGYLGYYVGSKLGVSQSGGMIVGVLLGSAWWIYDAYNIGKNRVTDSDGNPLERTDTKSLSRSLPVQWLIMAIAITVGMIGVLWAVSPASETSYEEESLIVDFPKKAVSLPLDDWIDSSVDWMATGWRFTASRAVSDKILWTLVRLERFLKWLPWWILVVSTALLAWRTAGWRIGVLALVGLVFVGAVDLWDQAMKTLALMTVATLFAVAIGIPVGVAAAKNNKIDAVLKPILDAMQTMPSFVYLVPFLLIFSIGKVPAIMATVIYAVPPAIRLTNLGIRLVDPEVVEAAKSFGTTGLQLLVKVQLPLAMPNIMAGVNQTVMMVLAMVIVASLVGAGGLGAEVLKGISRLEVGTGTIAGLSVVLMAILIDRITQGIGKSKRTKSDT